MTSGTPFISYEIGMRNERELHNSRRSSDSSTDSSWVTDFTSISGDSSTFPKPKPVSGRRTPDFASRTTNVYLPTHQVGSCRQDVHTGPYVDDRPQISMSVVNPGNLGCEDSERGLIATRHLTGRNSQHASPMSSRGRPRNHGASPYSDEETAENLEGTDQAEKVKTKLMSVWNNVKYGWAVRMKTNFSYESPIWLLGQCYHSRLLDSQKRLDSKISSPAPADNVSMDHFKQDFISRIWFTYRREFPVLSGSSLTTDCGWGCMLRSGQMMLAHALVCHYLGRGWRWNPSRRDGTDALHRMIIRWFSDHPKPGIPFSVHKLVAIGESSGKKAGDWYGPASVAYILRQALKIATPENLLLDDVCIYVAQDCAVYIQDVVDLATASSACCSKVGSGCEATEESTHQHSLAPSHDSFDPQHPKECECNLVSGLPCYHCTFKSSTEEHHANGSSTLNEETIPKKLHLGDQEMKHSLSSDWLENVNYSRPVQSFPTAVCVRLPDGSRSQDSATSGPSSLPIGTLENIVDSSPGRHERWKGVVIFVPVRLGGENLNCIYIPCVRSLLAHDNCIGIIGGRPKHSLYFVGWQDDKLIYMDPHYCQETVDVHQSTFPFQSFHCTSPRKMSFNRMDPSCTIGFYCRTRKDFMDFTRNVKEMLVPPGQKGDYPIFVICDGRSSENAEVRHNPGSHTTLSGHGGVSLQHSRNTGLDMEHEDFVFL